MKQFKGTVKLKELCKYMRIQHFDTRETIITEGDIGDTFYIIYSGGVSVYKQQKNDFTDSVSLVNIFAKLKLTLTITDSFNGSGSGRVIW